MKLRTTKLCIFLLLLSINLWAQRKETPKKSTSFGVGLNIDGTKTNSALYFSKPNPIGLNIGTSIFLEKEVLPNIDFSTGLKISKLHNASNYDIFLYAKDEREEVYVKSGESQGEVEITKVQLKIPLRARIYYYTKPRIRIFLEPSVYWSKDLWTKFQHDYKQTITFEKSTQIYLDPPQIDDIRETLDLRKSRSGWSLSTGVLLNTTKGKQLAISIQYQREKISLTSLVYKKVNILGLELRYILGRSKKKTKAKEDKARGKEF